MVNQRATAEMESAKERFESIFNTGPDASVITNLATGNIVDCNEGYIALSGFTKNELIGKPPAANNLWCSLEERQKVINELKEKGRVDNYEACFQRKDGKQIIGLFSAKVVKLNGIAHTVSITRDVTDRHVAQEKLRESEEKFRLLHENAGIGIGYYTLDGTVISYNQVAAANMGGVPEDFIGKSIYDLFPKKEAEEYHDRIINAANTGQPVTYEDLIKLPNENKYFLSTFTKITDMNNNLAGIQILSQDITERKQIETKLRESEEQFRLAFLTGTDAFYIATLEEGLILEVNNNFESVFGYTRDEAIGQTSLHLGLYDNPADRARMVSAIKSKGYIRDMELQGRKKGGKKITVSISIGLLTINHKPHILGIIRDITERKRAESALKQSEEKYRQLFTMMGEGFALHEIILDSESKPIDYRLLVMLIQLVYAQ